MTRRAQALLFSGAGDSSVRAWDLASGSCLLYLAGSPGLGDITRAHGHMDWVNAVLPAPTAAARAGRGVTWRAGGGGQVSCVGDFLFSGSVDRTIRRWNVPALLRERGAHAPQWGGGGGAEVEAAAGASAMYDTFAWGYNVEGALGDGTTDAARAPVPLTTLQGVMVRAVACGAGTEEHHSVALTEQGRVYAWGSGRSGQLGHGDTQSLVLPRIIAGLDGRVVARVACGSAHTLALEEGGALWSWGWGHFGQLGHGAGAGAGNVTAPARVVALEGVVVARIGCGSAHSTAATDTGVVFTWGWGVNGQLGHGDAASLPAPAAVKALQGVHVSFVACGLAHTVAAPATAPAPRTASPPRAQNVGRACCYAGLALQRRGGGVRRG
jgi:hypothetical protein